MTARKHIVMTQAIPLGDIQTDGTLVRLPMSTILTPGEHNGIVFLEEEIAKIKFPPAFPLTLDHSRSVEDEVGWWENPTLEGGKLRAVPVINLETAKGKVALGYVKNRMQAGLTPEVSVEVWVDIETKDGKQYARNIELDKASLVDRGACGPDKGCGIGLQKEECDDEREMVEMGVVPTHPWKYKTDATSAWSRPTLGDFTSKNWNELTDKEKKSIAGHFAWAPKNPPDRFTDLKLPHHDPKTHNVVWNGVRAAMAALLGARGGVNVPSADKPKIYRHLAQHYKEFDKTPPEVKFAEDGEPIEVLWMEEEDKMEFGQEKQTQPAVEETAELVSNEPEKAEMAEQKVEEKAEEPAPEPDYKALYEEVKAQLEMTKALLDEAMRKLKTYEDREREQIIAELKAINPAFNPEGKTLEQLRELLEFAQGLKLAKRKSFVVSDPKPEEEDYLEKLRKKMKELERRE